MPSIKAISSMNALEVQRRPTESQAILRDWVIQRMEGVLWLVVVRLSN